MIVGHAYKKQPVLITGREGRAPEERKVKMTAYPTSMFLTVVICRRIRDRNVDNYADFLKIAINFKKKVSLRKQMLLRCNT